MRENPRLPFGLNEYRDRLNRLQEAIGGAKLDGLMVHSPDNIYYLTGYHSVGYFAYTALVVTASGGVTLVIRDMIKSMVDEASWLDDLQTWTDTQDPIVATRNALEHQGLLGKTVGFDQQAWFYNIGHHNALLKSCQGTNFKEASGLVERVRKVKSPQEIEYIRKAAKTCEAAIEGSLNAVVEGATENDVAAATYYHSIKAGSEYLGHAMLIVAGRRSGVTFATWDRNPIERGDVMFLEMGGSYMRYHACLSRTAVVGEPSDKIKRMADVSRGALERAIEIIKPGTTAAEVDRAARSYIASQGMGKLFDHRLGYMIGIGFPPDWSEGRIMSIIENDDTPLEPGLTFHLVPSMKIDGEVGVIFSDTVLVTETGHEVLTNYPRELFVK